MPVEKTSGSKTPYRRPTTKPTAAKATKSSAAPKIGTKLAPKGKDAGHSPTLIKTTGGKDAGAVRAAKNPVAGRGNGADQVTGGKELAAVATRAAKKTSGGGPLAAVDTFESAAKNAAKLVGANKLQAFSATNAGATAQTAQAQDIKAEADKVRGEGHDLRQAAIIEEQLNAHVDDPAWKRDFVKELGPDLVGKAVGTYDPANPQDIQGAPIFENAFVDRSTTILAEARMAFTPKEFAKVIETAGPEKVANTIAKGLENVDHPFPLGGPPNENLERNLQRIASGIGSIARELGPNHEAVKGVIDPLMTKQVDTGLGNEFGRQEMAGWIVAKSGSTELKNGFLKDYLPKYEPGKPDSATTARSLLMVAGSISPPSEATKAIMQLPKATRQSLLNDAFKPGNSLVHERQGPSFGFGNDINEMVGNFLDKVAVLDSSKPGAAANLKTEAFIAAGNGLTNEKFGESKDIVDGLSKIFASDTDGLIGRLSNGAEGAYGAAAAGSKPLSNFFARALFSNDDKNSFLRTNNALTSYLGVGADKDGLLDSVVNGATSQAGFQNGGGENAHRLGFVLGALNRGANTVLGDIKNDKEARTKVLNTMAGLVTDLFKTGINADPKLKASYEAIQKGTGGLADIDNVQKFVVGELEKVINKDLEAKKGKIEDLVKSIFTHALSPLHQPTVNNSTLVDEIETNLNRGFNFGLGQPESDLRLFSLG